MSDIKFRPKGSMCMVCEHIDRDCSHLPFHNMLVIEIANDFRVVKCNEFERMRPEPLSNEEGEGSFGF